jgi:hypothetical protein
LQLLNRTRFFNSWLRTNRASHPSGSSNQRCSAFALAAFAAPEERWCRFASNSYHSFRGYRLAVPTPRWLALQAIRFAARATANGIPFSFMANLPTPLPGLPLPS